MAEPCIRYVRTLRGTNIRASLIFDVGRSLLSEFDPYHLVHQRISVATFNGVEDVPGMGPKAWRSLAVKIEKRRKLLSRKNTKVMQRVCALCRERAKELAA